MHTFFLCLRCRVTRHGHPEHYTNRPVLQSTRARAPVWAVRVMGMIMILGCLLRR